MPSRLDYFIRRVTAQRDCLNHAAREIAALPGPILELGLGNGRTYDHLRALFPDREIYVFERDVAAHPDCIPEPKYLFEGDFSDTVPESLTRIGARAALIHGDFGSANLERDARLAAWLSTVLEPLSAPGGLIITDRALSVPSFRPEALPDGVEEGAYFMYRNGATD